MSPTHICLAQGKVKLGKPSSTEFYGLNPTRTAKALASPWTLSFVYATDPDLTELQTPDPMTDMLLYLHLSCRECEN